MLYLECQQIPNVLTQNVLQRTEDLRKDGFHQSPKLVFLNIFGVALAFHNFSVDTSPLLTVS